MGGSKFKRGHGSDRTSDNRIGRLLIAAGVVVAASNAVACGSSQPEPKAATANNDSEAVPAGEESEEHFGTAYDEVPDVIASPKFLTTAQAVRPGGTFHLVFTLDAIDGYRLSWKHPGDVGGPISVKFTAPESFEVGPVLYPAPERFDIQGGLVAYGYKGSTALFAEVQAPSSLDTSAVYRFEVRAKWLACKKECVKEESNAFFELTASRSAPAPQMPEELRALFDRVPKPLSDVPGVETNWTRMNSTPTLTVSAKGVEFKDFICVPDDSLKFKKAVVHQEQLALEFERPQRSPRPVRGVVEAETDGHAAYYDLEVSWPNSGL